MTIKRKLMDAVVAGFGLAAGSELFREASKAVAKHAVKKELGDDSDDDERDGDAEPKAPARVDPKAAERARKQAEVEAKRAAEEKKRAAEEKKRAKEKAEKEIDAELAALKKRINRPRG